MPPGCRKPAERRETADMDWKKRLSLFWRGWGFSLLVVVVITFSFRSAIADWNEVPSGSMKPTIIEGDRIFVNKLAYDLKVPFTTWHLMCWGNPQRGDIVVFFSPADGKRLVKRVVGIPGDTIYLRDKQLFINGEAAKYEPLDPEIINQISPEQQSSYLFSTENIGGKKHPVMVLPYNPFFSMFGPVKVPQGHYFMMGDNRDNSADSRFFGFVDRNRVVGRATAVIISLNYENHHFPRWNRSFRVLF